METKAKKSGTHYISAKESRRISRQNRKIMRAFEKKKRRKNVPESEYLTQMKDPANIVEFDDLHTCFYTDVGTVKAVDGVTFSIPKESIVGVVGESGCGKSVTSLSLMQLVQGSWVRSAAAPSVFVPATVRCMTLPKCRRKT